MYLASETVEVSTSHRITGSEDFSGRSKIDRKII